jgi:hypothetical protein
MCNNRKTVPKSTSQARRKRGIQAFRDIEAPKRPLVSFKRYDCCKSINKSQRRLPQSYVKHMYKNMTLTNGLTRTTPRLYTLPNK